MITSMTGFGKAEGSYENKRYVIEIRSVNNRFCEITFKYPRNFATKDLDLKDIVRKKITRGKIFISFNIDTQDDIKSNLIINKDSIKYYYDILKSIRKSIGSKEKIKIDHLLHFSEILSSEQASEVDEKEFDFVTSILNQAIDDLIVMKQREGEFLKNDILQRIQNIEKETDNIFELGKDRIPNERTKLLEKITSLMDDKNIVDEKRLELEIILLTEKLDITEECIRLKSHTKYFIDCANSEEFAGRRLNFLLQEMNREINTIASKAMDSTISQKGSFLKEELEKIREQIQNIE